MWSKDCIQSCEQKLGLKGVSRTCEQKLWTQVLSKSCEYKLWTKVVNKNFEQKFKTKALSKNCEKKYEWKLWIKVLKKYCEQKLWTKFWTWVVNMGCEHAGFSIEILAWGGTRPPPIGGQRSDGGGLARDSRQNSEVSQISK